MKADHAFQLINDNLSYEESLKLEAKAAAGGQRSTLSIVLIASMIIVVGSLLYMFPGKA